MKSLESLAFLQKAGEMAPATFIAHVTEESNIDWDNEGLQPIGCPNVNAARLKLMAAARRFKTEVHSRTRSC